MELLPVFGWAWLFYALFGLASGLCILGVTAATAALPRFNLKDRAHEAAIWFSLTLIVLTLAKGIKLWIGIQYSGPVASWLSRKQNLVIVTVLLANAVAVFRYQTRHLSMQRVAKIGAICSSFVALSSPFVSFFLISSQNLPRPLIANESVNIKNKHPNIILVTVDTLTANHMSLYGYAWPTTLNLEKLAQSATVFDRFYANSNFTTPGVCSLINGLRSWSQRANQALARVDANIGDAGLFARLARAGYKSYSVWTNPIAASFHHQNDRWMNATAYGDIHASAEGINALISARFPYFIPVTGLGLFSVSCKIIDHLLVLAGFWTSAGHYNPEPAIRIAQNMVEERDARVPMFLWVHLAPPHSPYATPSPFVGRFDPSFQRRGRFD